MRCARVLDSLSAYRDGALEGGRTQLVAEHLERCARCAERWRSLTSALDALAELPHVTPAEPILRRVQDRIEVESRGPGLALLFRPIWVARPLMLPSLLHASLVVVALLTSALALDAWSARRQEEARVRARERRAARAAALQLPEAAPPRKLGESGALAERLVTSVGAGNLFVETVIAPDGSVLAVRLIEGNAEDARELIDALRQERFEPAASGRRRVVAVSIYQLISHTEVLPTSS